MKVTHVSIVAAEAAFSAGRPGLTPELLAATGARYSRSSDGLEIILNNIDPEKLDASVDRIFRMVDYGHASIADMAPVAMFMDGLSQVLAYNIWKETSIGGGQECSTRFIQMNAGGLLNPKDLGIPDHLWGQWADHNEAAFKGYEHALGVWSSFVEKDPSVARIPSALLASDADKDKATVARMIRNYGFDRARIFLPTGIATNVMLVQSARAWVTLCEYLLSSPLPEANALGEAIRGELELVAPRLLKHAVARDTNRRGQLDEFARYQSMARGDTLEEALPEAWLEVMLPRGISEADLVEALAHHENRYAWIGHALRRTAVRFGWDAVGFAEVRDHNRHRTGEKDCPLVPQGFHTTLDQVPEDQPGVREQLAEFAKTGFTATNLANSLLKQGDPTYVYWMLFGTQVPFEHTTTGNKFVYQCELRTGPGSHYRYAGHHRDVLALLYERFPSLKGVVLEGSAEPE